MEVVVGTYDEIILGYRLVKVGEALQVESSFTDRSHAGCVKCVSVSPKGVLASGGTDEHIRLLDLKKKKEMGSLVHHSGSITAVDFHKGFMFSASEDGCMCLWKTHNWDCLRTFKGHKSAVHSVSVHPSGKLALTVGKDKTMHTWNLMTGKCAYVTNLKQAADIVKWSVEGDTYAVVINSRIDIYSVKTTAIIGSVTSEGRINCIEFLQNDVVVYGGEGSTCVIQNISEETPILQYDTSLTRIKGLCISPSPVADSHHSRILTVAGSDGKWIVYKVREKEDEVSLDLIVQHNTNFRLTCLAVYNKTSSQTEAETVTEVVEEAEEVQPHCKDTDTNKAAQKKQKHKRKFREELDTSVEGLGKDSVSSSKKMKQKTKELKTETKTKEVYQKSQMTAKLKKKKKKFAVK